MHEVRLRTIRSNPRTCITRRTGPPTASS